MKVTLAYQPAPDDPLAQYAKEVVVLLSIREAKHFVINEQSAQAMLRKLRRALVKQVPALSSLPKGASHEHA